MLAANFINSPNLSPAFLAGFHCAIPNDPSFWNPETAAGLISPRLVVAPDSTQKLPIIPAACCGVNWPPAGDIKKLNAFSIFVFPFNSIVTSLTTSCTVFLLVSIFGIDPNTNGNCEFRPSKNIPNTWALTFNCELLPWPELPSSVTGMLTWAHGKSSSGMSLTSAECNPCILTLTRSNFKGSILLTTNPINHLALSP